MTLQELGAELRRTREASGLTDKEISMHLRIPVALVSAIEDGNPDCFPHQVYARGSIKAYALMMRVPLEDVRSALSELDGMAVEQSIPTSSVAKRSTQCFSPVKSEGGGRLTAMIAGVVVLALAVVIFVYRDEIASKFAGLLVFGDKTETSVESSVVVLPAPTAETSVSAKASAGSDGGQKAEAGVPPQVVTPSEGKPSGADAVETPMESSVFVQGSGVDGTEARGDVAQPSSVDGKQLEESADARSGPVDQTVTVANIGETAAPSDTGALSDGDVKSVGERKTAEERLVADEKEAIQKTAKTRKTGKRHVIDVTCVESTWLSFRPENGKRRNVEMRPGEKFSYEFSGSVTVRLGNAGGVFLHFDGVPQRNLGKSGDVKSVTFPR